VKLEKNGGGESNAVFKGGKEKDGLEERAGLCGEQTEGK